jgi:polysaccharide export outer membrane protein
MIKLNKQIFFVFFLSIILFYSCADRKSLLLYTKAPNQQDTIALAKSYTPQIQPGDILSIFVSSLSPEASSFFNPFSVMGSNSSGPSASGSSGQTSTQGYLVDVDGDIELPLIGTMNIKGYTTIQAMDTIKEKLKIYLKEPAVTVRFLNYKISITGEVGRPSVYVISNEMITLPEAIAMAGDLTLFAQRNDVIVVRNKDGKKEFGHVNLNTREVYNSPYYYLHNNDMVYVQPTKAKARQIDNTIQLLSIGLSVLSFIFVYFRR